MESVAALERAFRDTDGEAVEIGAVTTWGHLDAVAPGGFGAPGAPASGEAGALVRAVTIPRQPLPALHVGAAIRVGGVDEVVRGVAPVERDPALLRVLLLDWTHVVTLFRPQVLAASGRGRRQTGWSEVKAGIRGTLIPGAGGVEGELSGQRVHAAATGFFLPGSGFQPGDGVLVTEGPGPQRYVVQAVADSGIAWGQRVELAFAREAFG